MSAGLPKILIVDDNPDLIDILRELMSRDFDVSTARTGEDAIAMAEREQPDIIILDLQLPGMDGMEAGRWIKAKLGRVPILALTALAGNGDPETILKCGCCDAYLAKPAPLSMIRAKVEEMLSEVGYGAVGERI